MKKIYYYNRKYPEFGIKGIEVKDEEYQVNSKDKWLVGIYSDYDIEWCHTVEGAAYFISLYSPYNEEGIYVHDNTVGNELVFSYDLDKIIDWINGDIEIQEAKLRIRLERLEIKKNSIDYKIITREKEV